MSMQARHEASRAAGRMIMDLSPAMTGLTPRKILTRQPRLKTPLPRCAQAEAATNAVLHLIAIARELRHTPSSMDDFDRISGGRRHSSATFLPGGKYVAKDYQDAGGSRVLAARLIGERGLLHDGVDHSLRAGRCAEEAALRPSRHRGQPVIREPWSTSAEAYWRPGHHEG